MISKKSTSGLLMEQERTVKVAFFHGIGIGKGKKMKEKKESFIFSKNESRKGLD